MKKSVWVLVLSMITLFLSAQDTTGAAIAANKFERKIKKRNVVILDVRTPEEYKAGYISKAINYNVLDSINFVKAVQPLDKNKKYFLYCQGGRRSGKALMMMQQMGFTNIHHLAGGITDWKSEIKKPE
jgi:phage shock protein E